ncbi:MAG: penicillin acylase family protein [Chloroflexota bacterium]
MRLPARARATLALARGLGRSVVATATHRAFPQVDGVLRVEGISAPIEIVRDHHGVPHVFAQTSADALFGQGVVHAQDRLFQMDLLRRVAAGRLSEVAGDRTLTSDRFMRRLGFEHAVERDRGHRVADGRQFRHGLDARAASQTQRAQLARAYMRLCCRKSSDQHLHLPTHSLGQRGASTFIRHMHHVHTRSKFEQLGGQLSGGTDT